MEEQVEVSRSKGTTDFGLDDIKFDLVLCIPIDQYPSNIRDDVIFAYLEKGPTQPSNHNFPINGDDRRFRPQWYKDFD